LNFAKGELSVDQQVMRLCAQRGWQLTMLAQDGSMLEDVRERQLPYIPETATHIVVSASGNDLLALLNQMVVSNFSVRSVYASIVAGLAQVAESYRNLMQALKSLGCHVACCTVYRPNFEHLFFKTLATFALSLHNSRIKSASVEFDISVVDLAVLFDDKADFANPLELSTQGGGKVTWNIGQFLENHPSSLLSKRRYDSHILYGDDDMLQPAGPCRLAPMRCCATKAPLRRVYASKQVAEDFSRVADDANGEPGLVGSQLCGELGPALDFSEAQQHWRKM